MRATTMSDEAVLSPETRWKKWIMFIVGNLMSAAVDIWELVSLRVCFDEYQGDSPDEQTAEQRTDSTYKFIAITLVSGLFINLMSAIILSSNYRAPLDIKSVHKIPVEDARNYVGTCTIDVWAPLSWALIYIFGGGASVYYGEKSLCDGEVEDERLLDYLVISGGVMGLIGLGMLFLAMEACCECCCRDRATFLSKGTWLDLVWQLQGLVLSYRVGSFGLVEGSLAGCMVVAGELMAAGGSFPPDVL